ncbi:MAG: hypothetical protein WCE80_03550 [Acidimicrobiia bacterium]
MEDNISLPEAEALAATIIKNARADEHVALLAIDADPRTAELLDLLPEGEARQAEAHLRDTRIWRANANEKARRKFMAASKALDELDVTLARGILRKIDAGVLNPPELERYDELLLAVEARTVELEDIEKGLPPLRTDAKHDRRKKHWRR